VRLIHVPLHLARDEALLFIPRSFRFRVLSMKNQWVRELMGALAACACVALICGCGGSSASKGRVTGKVVTNGQPVTGGALTFMPVDSKSGAMPAMGKIKTDGTFVVTTDKEGDGAAIGKHTISYSSPPVETPEWDGYGTPPPQPKIEYQGYVPKENQVEVKAGQNELTVEIVPGAGGAR
jgi:hypothetical protein